MVAPFRATIAAFTSPITRAITKPVPSAALAPPAARIQRELGKLVNAPYFLVTFTLPAELRGQFFGPLAKQAFDLFFAAVSGALAEKLATDKGLCAPIHGFTALLHTWTQRLEVHIHIHCLVPGAGLDAYGQFVRVKNPNRLVHLPHLQAAFRRHMYRLLQDNQWQVDPQVWSKDWGVHIQPAGSGAAALKYLGHYVARTAINNSRLLDVNEHSVTFRWKDRAHHNRTQTLSLPGEQFVGRYLRHVLPMGLRSGFAITASVIPPPRPSVCACNSIPESRCISIPRSHRKFPARLPPVARVAPGADNPLHSSSLCIGPTEPAARPRLYPS